MFLQVGPLPLGPDGLGLPLVEALHPLPLVLGRPRQPHEVPPRESPVLRTEDLLHLVHVLHVQPEMRSGKDRTKKRARRQCLPLLDKI